MDSPSTSASVMVEEDEVLKEVPIYHSSELRDRLYVFRYPLLPKEGFENVPVRKGFFKPNNGEVKLEMAIGGQETFDIDRAELKAQEIDSASEKRDAEVLFENEMVDKTFLISKKVEEVDDEVNKYAALVFNGREVHLTVLKDVLEMWPSFQYMEKKPKGKRDTDHNDMSDEEEAGPSSAQHITVKFQGTDKWNKKKSATFKELDDQSKDEPWSRCDFHHSNSTRSKLQNLKLFSADSERRSASDLPHKDYCEVLVPKEEEEIVMTETTVPADVLPFLSLKGLSLVEQCEKLLCKGKIMSFSQISEKISGENVTRDALLKAVSKVAMLVQGNWIVKSELLYPDKTFSSLRGVPAELMCRARDHVLYEFTKGTWVDKNKVPSVHKVPGDEVNGIFSEIARFDRNKGWELTLSPNTDFIAKHSELVQRQTDMWELRYAHICKLNDSKRQRRKSKSVSDAEGHNRMRNGRNCSISSDNDSGPEKNKSPIFARKNRKLKGRDASQDSSS